MVAGWRAVASASSDATAQVWDAATGAPALTFQGHESPIYALSWGHTGSIATGGQETTVRIWQPDSGACRFIYTGHTTKGTTSDGQSRGIVRAIAWSPNASQIASASRDTFVRVWSAPPL
jgi:WD40 repeat protein